MFADFIGRSRWYRSCNRKSKHGSFQKCLDSHVCCRYPLYRQNASCESYKRLNQSLEADDQAVLFYWTFTNLYSLLQAYALRQPFVKSLFRIPSPPPSAPLPPGVEAPKQPTYAETWKALRENLSTKGAAWQQAKARHEASLGVKEREGGMRKGSALMVERVREKGVAPGVPAAGGQLAGAAVPAATASWQEGAAAERGGKEEMKARRVAAAREKRMRQ